MVEHIVEVIKALGIIGALVISLISFYYSRFQGANIKPIEIQEQTPLGAAHHSVIFTNYGSRTGVIIGPDVHSDEEMEVSVENRTSSVIPVKARDTVLIEVKVETNSDKDIPYYLYFKDEKGKEIRLPEHTYKSKPTAS